MTLTITRKGGKSRYLILGFSLDTAFDGQRNPPPAVVCTIGSASRIIALDLPYEEPHTFKNLGQWRLAIEVNSNDRSTAMRIFSAFEALLTHVNHGRIDDLSLELLPGIAMDGRRIRFSKFVSAAGRQEICFFSDLQIPAFDPSVSSHISSTRSCCISFLWWFNRNRFFQPLPFFNRAVQTTHSLEIPSQTYCYIGTKSLISSAIGRILKESF